MMYETTSLSDWLSGLSAGMAGLALVCLALAFADADLVDFDPRPALRRAAESGEWDRLLNAVANTKHAARETASSAAMSARGTAAHIAVALLLLVAPHTPETNR